MEKIFGFTTRKQWVEERIKEIQKQIKGMASNDMDVPLDWMREIVWLAGLSADT